MTAQRLSLVTHPMYLGKVGKLGSAPPEASSEAGGAFFIRPPRKPSITMDVISDHPPSRRRMGGPQRNTGTAQRAAKVWNKV